MNKISGIHHITAISSDALKTKEFYTEILGLRMVKKTVNFDSPDTYHLYFGDQKGNPGTLITFFPFKHAGTGMRGTGQATSFAFAVPKEALGFWLDRFITKNIKHSSIKERFGEKYITFFDFDGQEIELFGVENLGDKNVWTTKEISKENAIRSFHTVTLSVKEYEKTEKVLLEILNYKKLGQQENFYRYISKDSTNAKYIDIFSMPGWPEGIQSAGTVHHVAFKIDSEDDEKDIIKEIKKFNLNPTEVVDRKYFKSVYFREPNGILFEIATDGPGMDIDEDENELGKNFVLPPWFESERRQIEENLPSLDEDETDLSYIHKYIAPQNGSNIIFFLLHGTGADEFDLIPLIRNYDKDAGILSVRGNVVENGMNRFFERYPDGSFNEEDIKFRAKELNKFLHDAIKEYEIEDKKIVILGFSNGANIAASMLMLENNTPNYAILLRPTLPIEQEEYKNLKNKKILIGSGANDNYTSKEKVEELVQIFKDNGGNVDQYWVEGGHQLEMVDFEKIYEFVKKI